MHGARCHRRHVCCLGSLPHVCCLNDNRPALDPHGMDGIMYDVPQLAAAGAPPAIHVAEFGPLGVCLPEHHDADEPEPD